MFSFDILLLFYFVILNLILSSDVKKRGKHHIK